MISNAAITKATELLQTGDYFLVSWHDFTLVSCIIFSAGAVFGYCLANADLIKTKLRRATHG